MERNMNKSAVNKILKRHGLPGKCAKTRISRNPFGGDDKRFAYIHGAPEESRSLILERLYAHGVSPIFYDDAPAIGVVYDSTRQGGA